MNVEAKETSKHVKYTYFKNGGKSVCFMLAGSNYLYDKPLFYYGKMSVLQHGYDVVQVHYAYEPSVFEMEVAAFCQLITIDVESVVTEVLASQQYEELLIFGKSLGTIPICHHYLQQRALPASRFVVLTPLLQLEEMYAELEKSTAEMLIVIGMSDQHYDQQKIDVLQSKSNVSLLAIEGANHSLDVQPVHTVRSVQAIVKTVEGIERFIRGTES